MAKQWLKDILPLKIIKYKEGDQPLSLGFCSRGLELGCNTGEPLWYLKPSPFSAQSSHAGEWPVWGYQRWGNANCPSGGSFRAEAGKFFLLQELLLYTR